MILQRIIAVTMNEEDMVEHMLIRDYLHYLHSDDLPHPLSKSNYDLIHNIPDFSSAEAGGK